MCSCGPKVVMIDTTCDDFFEIKWEEGFKKELRPITHKPHVRRGIGLVALHNKIYKEICY